MTSIFADSASKLFSVVRGKLLHAAVYALTLTFCGPAFADAALVSGTQITGGGTYTAGAGSNRLVVIALARRMAGTTTTTPNVTALTWGSRSIGAGITEAVHQASTSNGRCNAYVWYVKEADIPAGAQTLAATWNVTMGGSGDLFTVYTLSGVNQTTPVNTTVMVDNGNGADPWTMAPTVASGSVQVTSGCIFAQSVASGAPPGFVEYRDVGDSTYRVFSDAAVTATGATLNWIRDFSTGSQQGSVVLSSFARANVTAAGVKWHPGHYISYNGNQGKLDSTERGKIQTWINGSLCTNADVKGIKVVARWAQLEGATAGSYQPGKDAVDALLDILAPCHKQLILVISERTFAYAIPDSELPLFYPEYLLGSDYGDVDHNAEKYGGVVKHAAGGTWTGGLTAASRLWDDRVMDRLSALAQAYGAYFNDSATTPHHHERFEMIEIGETAIGGSPPTWDPAGWYRNYKRFYSALAVSGPRIVGRMKLNFTNGDSNMRDMLVHCQSLGNCVVGGPDPELPSRSIQANRIYRGAQCTGCPGTTDWRNLIGWVGEQQALGFYGDPEEDELLTAQQSYDYQVSQNMRYMLWISDDATKYTQTLGVIAAHPGMATSACPPNFPACDTTP